MNRYKDYLPEFLGLTLAFLAMNLWYLSSLVVANDVIPVTYDYLAKGFTVLVGAFVGAYSAFRLNSKKEAEKEYKDQQVVMNNTLFTLIRQINAVKSIKKNFDEYENPLDRAFQLPAMKPPKYDDLTFDYDGLSFLLHDEPQFLMELTIEQSRFEQAFNAIEIRNDFYVNKLQPALSANNLNGRPMPIEEFQEKLGEMLFEGSINGAKSMYYHIEESDKSLVEMYNKASKLARKVFPGEKFIKWAPQA